ncbi:MAG: glutathione peroxidase [Epsilonproteobacteria bacterium]|nr:MAG: glutathione peroxidase [Campylobacterota bacterium]RLA67010.1 MAG: glutathione peroxidase [Campylobacterota bacterium]
MTKSIYNFKAVNIKGQKESLEKYSNKVLLIVNVASKCGFTPQYKGLEELYQSYQDRGLEILAFPCNQFGKQETGNENDILNFCERNYGVTFPLFSKIEVNGDGVHPLFSFLKKELPGILGSEKIKWNFTKFLIDRKGNPIKRFAPKDTPKSLIPQIEKLLE